MEGSDSEESLDRGNATEDCAPVPEGAVIVGETVAKREEVGGDPQQGVAKPSYTLHVHGLPDVDIEELEPRFQRFGEIVSCDRQGDLIVVKYSKTQDAYAAREKLNGATLYETTLKIEFGPQDPNHYNRGKKRAGARREFLDGDVNMDAVENDPGEAEAPLAIAKADENVEHKEGATVAEEPPRAAPALVCPDKPVSRWSEKLSFESQLEDFMKMQRRGMYNRYLVIGKLPAELRTGEAIWRMVPPVQRDILQVEMLTCFGKPCAHVTLRSATAAAAMHRLAEQWHPNLTIAFAPPRKPSSSLWLGNIDDFVPRQELETLLANRGRLVGGLRYMPARTCAFVTYKEVSDAVAARNLFYAMEVQRNQYLNVDFVDGAERGAGPHADAAWMWGGVPWNRGPWLTPPVPWGPRSAGAWGRRDWDVKPLEQRNRSPPVSSKKARRSSRSRSRRRHSPEGGRERGRESSPGAKPELDDENKPRLKLHKMGEFCCNIVANFVSGMRDSEALVTKLQVDQRTKIEHCRSHMEKAAKIVTVWHFSAADRRDCAAYDALCDYFVEKQRVGLVQTPSYYVYIVPPTQNYLETLGLPASNYVVGLQIPIKR